MNTSLIHREIILVNLHGKKYPITIEGTGIPVLVMGTGNLVLNSLSAKFKQHFKVYATELYFDARYALQDRNSLTLDNMLDDIKNLAETLGLSNYLIFGFSAFGIVALEFAKKYPHHAAGFIMAGTPLNSNQEVALQNNKIFQQYAHPQRKILDAERRELLAQEDLSSLEFHQKFLREYTYGASPRYWHQADFDCTLLWQGIVLDEVLEHFFASIIPGVDVKEELETIQEPIFFAAGLSDYDCCPAQAWGALKNKPPHMVLSIFEQSGHYPQYEESELFDNRVLAWARENFS